MFNVKENLHSFAIIFLVNIIFLFLVGIIIAVDLKKTVLSM